MGDHSATAGHAVGTERGESRPVIVRQQAFPGRTDQAGEARGFLAEVLADCPACLAKGCPAADDAVLCLSELAANAAVHSHSGRPGGSFTVRVAIGTAGRLRIEVSDEGGRWTWRDPHDQRGRGFVILRNLARDWGRSGDSATGWTVWFELECSGRGYVP